MAESEDGGGSAEADLGQRERLIDAFTKLAAEGGYERTTVETVAAAAGVVPDVFYQHFPDLRRCLSASYDTFVERLILETEQAMDGGQEWPLQVKEAVAASFAALEEMAPGARFFAVEALAAGPVSLERYLASLGRVAAMMRRGRNLQPGATDLPEATEAVLVGGLAVLVTGHLLAEEQAHLEGLVPELVEIILTPYLGRDEAKRIAA